LEDAQLTGCGARVTVWTGADAHEHGLVDVLGGLRTGVRRAKVLAGLDVEEKVRLVGYPGSSLRDYLRPKTSSQPAAASLSEAMATAASVAVGALHELLGRAERPETRALWLGNERL
jgi:protease-4